MPRDFHRTPVHLQQEDADWLWTIVDVLTGNPDNPAWGDASMPSIVGALGVKKRLEVLSAAAEASDQVRHRFEEHDGGSWETIDGDPVAYHAGGESYPVTSGHGIPWAGTPAGRIPRNPDEPNRDLRKPANPRLPSDPGALNERLLKPASSREQQRQAEREVTITTTITIEETIDEPAPSWFRRAWDRLRAG